MNNELILELLENPSFIKWVNSDFEINNEVWSDYIDQHPSYHESINEAIRTIRHLHGDDVVYERKDILFSKIEKTLEKNNTGVTVVRLTPLRKYLAYAASLLLLLVATIYFGGNKSYETGIGESLVVHLPDHSKVTLNAGSGVRFNSILWSWQRKVNLHGEAFFDVEKGSKFIVETAVGEVSVLGTTFNVLQTKGDMDVFCFTGRVSVQDKNKKEFTILTPGNGVILGQSAEMRIYQSTEDEPDWKTGREIFQNITLQEAVIILEKYFANKIILAPDIAGEMITADVPVSNLDSAIQHITWPLGLQYKIVGSEVNISR